jgi:hypothetical protein
MSTKLVNPAGLYDGAPVGMSQAKVDLESGFVFVSGQVDWDRESRVQHATLEGQAEEQGARNQCVAIIQPSVCERLWCSSIHARYRSTLRAVAALI